MADPLEELKARCLSAVDDIQHECAALLQDGAKMGSLGDDAGTALLHLGRGMGLSGCGEPLVQLLQRQASRLRSLYRDEHGGERESTGCSPEEILPLKRLEDILSASYSKFYAYLFKDLPVCWRQLYTDASILKFALLFLSWSLTSTSTSEATLDGMVKTLDLALILAGAAGEQRGRRWIDKAFALLEDAWRTFKMDGSNATGAGQHLRPQKRRRVLDEQPRIDPWQDTPSFSITEAFTPPIRCPIRRTHAVSLEAFQAHMNAPREDGSQRGPAPLVISGLTDDWPARTTRPWNKPAYLLSRTFDGKRLVPVEIGRSYVDDGWGQKIISFGDFLHDYIDPSDSTQAATSNPQNKTGYLAQHQLFTQLPCLRDDILIPDYCYTAPPGHPTDPSQDQPELDTPQLNAWFGPGGTITPLHTDPYHNLLVQVVGRKYVRLYAPEETGRMQARGKEGGVEMGNTSEIDVGVLEGWDGNGEDDDSDGNDDNWREGFRQLPYVECILEPGDTLYMPIGWWHYVRGLSVSFSVSFWWN
ncbi:hypothetical protein B0T22DRAFT_425541 [Podospora appendiculata]|uniref:JmjC domain-containing protein n=1 Tax=Podospora appendiculata TaxID=314037 RepID=A0AAE1CC45_9PEZI|nr:hypothetical protein B0T22DRAFT_425541 [Podospora appendiculata]